MNKTYLFSELVATLAPEALHEWSAFSNRVAGAFGVEPGKLGPTLIEWGGDGDLLLLRLAPDGRHLLMLVEANDIQPCGCA